MSSGIRIVGIDCATQPGNVGVCLATYASPTVRVEKVFTCTSRTMMLEEIAAFLGEGAPAIIALDAPLGWPVALTREISQHRAGEAVGSPAGIMFSRATDRYVKQALDKTPLEIGANLIARTALAALSDLNAIRTTLALPVPLAWEPGPAKQTVAIEVYPAATEVAYERAECHAAVSARVGRDLPADNIHKRDAVLCAIAASDFLEARVCRPPADERLLVP
jgi:predicted RNase H-like nuclease